MQAWVEKLVELQDIDLKIAKLELQLGELPKRQAEAELQYKAEADALAAATNDLKQAEVAAKGIETQITTARDKKRDFQAKTITIKNNDEYRAAILQIEMMDKAIADLEEKQIEAMILIERQGLGGRKGTCEDRLGGFGIPQGEFRQADCRAGGQTTGHCGGFGGDQQGGCGGGRSADGLSGVL